MCVWQELGSHTHIHVLTLVSHGAVSGTVLGTLTDKRNKGRQGVRNPFLKRMT